MGNDSNNRQPLVSIIIPVYNGTDFMREAIDSALNQTYGNIEVIVVNDGSSDDGKTAETALSYGERIRYFEKENGGVSSALNYGISHMKGDYFSWLSHDDVYLPNKIENQINFLMNNDCRDDTVAMCRADFIDVKSKIIRSTSSNTTSVCILDWQQALKRLLHDGCFIGCNLLIPKKAFEVCGVFDESLRYIQDYWMWFLIFSHGFRLACSMDIDVHNRIHGGQLTQKGRELFNRESEMLSDRVIPLLVDLSSRENDFLYHYALNCAKYHILDPVDVCIDAAKKKNLFSPGQVLTLKMYTIYGSARPFFRSIYYHFLKK